MPASQEGAHVQAGRLSNLPEGLPRMLAAVVGPPAIRRYSLTSGANRSTSHLVPSEPKSTSACAFSAVPRSATTVPIPKPSWLTRSPTSRLGIGLVSLAAPNVDGPLGVNRRGAAERAR